MLPALAAGMIATLVAIVIAVLWLARVESLRSAHIATSNLSRVLQEQTGRSLAVVDAHLSNTVDMWAQMSPGQLASAETMHRMLDRKAREVQYIRSMYVLDEHAAMLFDSESVATRGQSFPDRAYFKVHRDGEVGLHVSGMMRGRLTGRWGMVLSRRLSWADGSFAGVVVAALEPDWLERDYADLHVGSNGEVNLRNLDGQLVIQGPARDDARGEVLESTAFLLQAMGENGYASGEIRSSQDRLDRLYTVRRVADTPLMVFVALGKQDVLAPWWRMVAVYVAITAMVTGGIVFFTRRLLREQRRRERTLTSLTLSEAELRVHRDHLSEMVEARTRELVAAKDAAEQANRAKSEFLANISHELRTPMHAILSFARLGQDKIAGGSATLDKLTTYLQRIESSGDRLLRLLNDLLDLSKLEAGKMQYEMRPTNLCLVAGDALSEIKEVARRKGVEIVLPQHDAAYTVCGDAVRLGQVLRNLLSNAVKFTPSGASVRVACEGNHRLADGQPALRMSVIDGGTGLPEDELQSVFEKFVQSSTTASGAGGTGLGLSICREIVKQHGGRIWLVNNPEGGATAHVLLPCAAVPVAQQDS